MSVFEQLIADQPAGVCVVDEQAELAQFRDPSCAAAIWQRDIPVDVATWLEDLDPSVLPKARVTFAPADAEKVVESQFDRAAMPEGNCCAWLLKDIAEQVQVFAHLMHTPYVRLRLEAVTTNACRKFHLDAVTGRLVCTYRGTGTQYGTPKSGCEPETIFTVPTGASILLRGSLWPPVPATGLLHRSPPIEGSGETRFVMVIDPISDLENAE